MTRTMKDEKFWRYGNYFYGAAILLVPLVAFELGYRYLDSLSAGILLAIICLPLYIIIGKFGTLSELADDWGWSNPAKEKGYFFKSLLIMFGFVIAILLSTFITLGAWQVVLSLFISGTVLHNYACYISHLE